MTRLTLWIALSWNPRNILFALWSQEGMLQNRIYRGKPEATCTNPKDAPNAIFFVVDTTDAAPMSEPYTLEITRK